MTHGNEFRGIPIKTLEVSDPNIRGRKAVVRAIPLAFILDIVVMASLAVTTFKNDPMMQWAYLFLGLIIGLLNLGVYIFMHAHFGGSWYKIVFYDNGIAFPAFLWNRIRGRKAFVPRDQIASVRGAFFTSDNVPLVGTSELRFRTKDGKTYATGPRINKDIQMISDWIESTWELSVERVGGPSRPIPSPHKIAVVTSDRSRTCIGCGYSFPKEDNFCPSCGRMASNGTGPAGRDVPEVREQPPVPAEPLTAPYQYQPPRPQSQLAPVQQNRYGQELAPQPQGQYAPVYQNPYATPQYPVAPGPNPAYGQYPAQPMDPYAKNPRLATILAVVLGLLGMPGIGHLYMRKYLKGIVLLMLGGFLALVSLVSIMMLFTPDQFSFGVHLITTALVTAPFLLLFIWQVFDAPKPKKQKASPGDYGYYRPPNTF